MADTWRVVRRGVAEPVVVSTRQCTLASCRCWSANAHDRCGKGNTEEEAVNALVVALGNVRERLAPGELSAAEQVAAERGAAVALLRACEAEARHDATACGDAITDAYAHEAVARAIGHLAGILERGNHRKGGGA